MGWLDKLRKIVKQEKNGELNELQTEQTESDDIDNQTVLNHVKQLSLTDKEKEEQVSSLTTESDIYILLVEGFTIKEVAEQLGIEYSTANTHMTEIYRKLDINTGAELIINYRNILK